MLSLLSISTFAADLENNENTAGAAESECIMDGHFKKSEVESAIKDQSNYSKVEIEATWMTVMSPIKGFVAITALGLAKKDDEVDRYMDLNVVRDGVTHQLRSCIATYNSTEKTISFGICKDPKTGNFVDDPGTIDVSKLTPCS